MSTPLDQVSLGPVVSEVSRLFAFYTEGPSMYSEFEPDTTDEMLEAQMDAVEAFGITLETYNSLLRSRTGLQWLNRHGSWAVLPTRSEWAEYLEEA